MDFEFAKILFSGEKWALVYFVVCVLAIPAFLLLISDKAKKPKSKALGCFWWLGFVVFAFLGFNGAGMLIEVILYGLVLCIARLWDIILVVLGLLTLVIVFLWFKGAR